MYNNSEFSPVKIVSGFNVCIFIYLVVCSFVRVFVCLFVFN